MGSSEDYSMLRMGKAIPNEDIDTLKLKDQVHELKNIIVELKAENEKLRKENDELRNALAYKDVKQENLTNEKII